MRRLMRNGFKVGCGVTQRPDDDRRTDKGQSQAGVQRRPPQARLTAEPKLLMGYEKARLGLETQRSQTEEVIPILTAWKDGHRP